MIISSNIIEKVLLEERTRYSTDPLQFADLGNSYPSQESNKGV